MWPINPMIFSLLRGHPRPRPCPRSCRMIRVRVSHVWLPNPSRLAHPMLPHHPIGSSRFWSQSHRMSHHQAGFRRIQVARANRMRSNPMGWVANRMRSNPMRSGRARANRMRSNPMRSGRARANRIRANPMRWARARANRIRANPMRWARARANRIRANPMRWARARANPSRITGRVAFGRIYQWLVVLKWLGSHVQWCFLVRS